MKNPQSNLRSISRMISVFAGVCCLAQASAKEHSWVFPLGCTPSDLVPMMIDRQMVHNAWPVLLPQEKLVVKLDEARLVLEVMAIEAKGTKVGWLWIGPKKVLSGTVLIENSELDVLGAQSANKSFEFESVGGAELKGVRIACSADVKRQRTTFSTAGKPYAWVPKEDGGRQAAPADGGKPGE